MLVISKVFTADVLKVAPAGSRGWVADRARPVRRSFSKRRNWVTFIRNFAKTADAIVVSTSAMGETIALRFGRHSTVIDDPFEAPLGEPCVSAPAG